MKNLILAIDPGNINSAYVLFDGEIILECGKLFNVSLLDEMTDIITNQRYNSSTITLAIERYASYGMAVGQTSFDTCVWSGRFIQHFLKLNPFGEYQEVFRRDVKIHHCGHSSAKDANIIQVLKDRFEPNLKQRERPKSFLKNVKSDIWQAFALCLYYYDVFILKKSNF